MAQPKSQTTLDAPASSNTVRVRLVDTTAQMVLHSKIFIKPVVPGHETMNGPDFAFLIENDRLERKVMFDLGVRKDYWNLPPMIQQRMDNIATGLRIPKDIKDILTEQAIPLESINDIIWSHTHWDHVGDTTLFPPSTNLVYGPGVPASKPGYPENPKSPIHNSSFENRENIEITFPEDGLKVGGFPAHDFFDDGSFYLLSTPGHATGHMCALARTTADTFILLGGDVCHFTGDLRPNASYPLPDPIPDGVLDHDSTITHPCPASFFLDDHPQFPPNAHSQPQSTDTTRNTTPYYVLSTAPGTVYETPSTEVAQKTVKTLIASFDSAANVLVALAHDPALYDLPTLNSNPEADLNDWFARGWKEKSYWGWLNEVPKKGKPGRKRLVDGWWREGRRYETAAEMLEDGKSGSEKL